MNLAQNENPLGLPKHIIDALFGAYNELSEYPEPHSASVKQKLSELLGLPVSYFFVSAGLVESLDIFIRNFIKPKHNFIVGQYSFAVYRQLSSVFGGNVLLAEMPEYKLSVPAILALYDEEKTDAIIIDNPNNPTGSIITEAALLELLHKVSPRTLVVVDEAYCEYVTDKTYPNTLSLLPLFPNLIVMRTFSKIYALAGLRVGYSIGSPEVIKRMEYYQAPFTVNKLGAKAAILVCEDEDFRRLSAQSNSDNRTWLYDALRALGLKVVEPHGNFVLIIFECQERRDNLFDYLLQQGILTTKPDIFGATEALRISIGLEKDNDFVLKHIKQWLLF
jgi:histidinol-phosphate aminotransferase